MISGGVRRKTPNQRASMRRSAEHRRCPKCERRSALGQSIEIESNFRRVGSYRRCRYCGHESGIIDGKTFGFSPKTEREP